jgi:hypothetical protein
MEDLRTSKQEVPGDPAFALHWKERMIVAMLMFVGFMTSFESTGVGPPLSVSQP